MCVMHERTVPVDADGAAVLGVVGEALQGCHVPKGAACKGEFVRARVCVCVYVCMCVCVCVYVCALRVVYISMSMCVYLCIIGLGSTVEFG